MWEHELQNRVCTAVLMSPECIYSIFITLMYRMQTVCFFSKMLPENKSKVTHFI